jgi:hypothetical protein
MAFRYGNPRNDAAIDMALGNFRATARMISGSLFVWSYLVAEAIERASVARTRMDGKVVQRLEGERRYWPDQASILQAKADARKPLEIDVRSDRLRISVGSVYAEFALDSMHVLVRCSGIPPILLDEPTSVQHAKEIATTAIRKVVGRLDGMQDPFVDAE